MGSYKTFKIRNHLEGKVTDLHLKFNRGVTTIGLDGVAVGDPDAQYTINEYGTEVDIAKDVDPSQVVKIRVYSDGDPPELDYGRSYWTRSDQKVGEGIIEG